MCGCVGVWVCGCVCLYVSVGVGVCGCVWACLGVCGWVCVGVSGCGGTVIWLNLSVTFGSYVRLIDSYITQLEAQGPSRTCNESQEEEEEGVSGWGGTVIWLNLSVTFCSSSLVLSSSLFATCRPRPSASAGGSCVTKCTT